MRAIAADYGSAPLSDRERAILDYAAKLSHAPSDVSADDVQALRTAGLNDGEILDVCQVASYYNYVNRLASGLGVELETVWGDAEPQGNPDSASA